MTSQKSESKKSHYQMKDFARLSLEMKFPEGKAISASALKYPDLFIDVHLIELIEPMD